MPSLTKKDFQQLMETTDGPCISFFMPTHQFGADTLQDPVRLKNLLRAAERDLEAWGLRRSVTDEILAPVEELVADYDFWQHQSHGLAVFCSPGLFRRYCVPLRPPELQIVAGRFHLKPLLPLVTRDDRFYVLALSQSRVRLFLATREGMQELEVEDLQAVNQEPDARGTEKLLGSHSTGPRNGARGFVLHGSGGGDEDRKGALETSLRRTEHAVRAALSQEEAPLVLAGVDYLSSMYRKVNSYRHLLEEWVAGSFDRAAGEGLHAKALPIVGKHFAETQREAGARYLELRHTDRTSAELAQVLPAAYYGRIQLLFVPVGVQTWGRFKPDTSEVEFVEQPGPADQDLLNLAALHTYLTGGAVFAVEPRAVPGNGPLAAVLRY